MTYKYLGQDLIFIISQPRSGSTLLQRILSGHPDVGASSEPWIMLHQAHGRGEQHTFARYGADWAALGVNEFVKNYTDGDEVYDDAVRAFAQTLYANAMRKADARLFIDKTPRYVLIVQDLIRLFPEAKFIFLIRNPLSVLSSIVRTQINHDLTSLERFSDELLVGPNAILKGIESLGDKAAVVRYENFVEKPEAELEKLCAYIGISFDAQMVEYTNTPEFEGFMQDRTGIQQHTRPTSERALAWQQMLDDPQALEFACGYLNDLGAETVKKLGYDYGELSNALSAAMVRAKRSGYLLPWHVAILSPEDKRGRDQMHVFKYRQIRDHGPITGRFMTYGRFLKGLWQALAFSFGSAKRMSSLSEEERDRARR